MPFTRSPTFLFPRVSKMSPLKTRRRARFSLYTTPLTFILAWLPSCLCPFRSFSYFTSDSLAHQSGSTLFRSSFEITWPSSLRPFSLVPSAYGSRDDLLSLHGWIPRDSVSILFLPFRSDIFAVFQKSLTPHLFFFPCWISHFDRAGVPFMVHLHADGSLFPFHFGGILFLLAGRSLSLAMHEPFSAVVAESFPTRLCIFFLLPVSATRFAFRDECRFSAPFSCHPTITHSRWLSRILFFFRRRLLINLIF